MLPKMLGAFLLFHMFKRAFDFAFSALALILLFPLMGLCILGVYLEDGSPVILRQTRVGKNGRLFGMFKIRTMVKDAEQWALNENLIHKTKDDPRVTRVGRVLRRFSLDELPQLFNVLEGTMSIVGPRPELPHFAERYESWQRERFSVMPGITGWWQINNRNEQPMHLHIEDDLYYIQNYSIWLDFQIILRTIWVVLSGRGAY